MAVSISAVILSTAKSILQLLGGPKIGTSNIGQFSNFFHFQNQDKIYNNIITKDPIAHQVCRYDYLVKCQCLKAIIENKTTSVTTHLVRRPLKFDAKKTAGCGSSFRQ